MGANWLLHSSLRYRDKTSASCTISCHCCHPGKVAQQGHQGLKYTHHLPLSPLHCCLIFQAYRGRSHWAVPFVPDTGHPMKPTAHSPNRKCWPSKPVSCVGSTKNSAGQMGHQRIPLKTLCLPFLLWCPEVHPPFPGCWRVDGASHSLLPNQPPQSQQEQLNGTHRTIQGWHKGKSRQAAIPTSNHSSAQHPHPKACEAVIRPHSSTGTQNEAKTQAETEQHKQHSGWGEGEKGRGQSQN